MDDFKIIYRILKTIYESMDYEEFNKEAIKADTLGITEQKWQMLMGMLIKNGYIEGVSLVLIQGLGVRVKLGKRPQLTLAGLEYLAENSLMKKAANLAKGIIDTLT